MKKILLVLILLFLGVFFFKTRGSSHEIAVNTGPPISHEIWDGLLKKHVDEDGWVDYKGFQTDRSVLDAYLNIISKQWPAGDWSKEEKLSFWINAYNAYTIQLILDNYPIKSIKDIQINIPGIYTIWHKEFFSIGGRQSSLDEIEHGILRKEFNEPRIHFAIVCASISCPSLRNEAFTSKRINEQLDDQAKLFLNDPTRNKLDSDKVSLSKIFSWFKEDFTKDGSLIDYLNQYAEEPVHKKAKVRYLDYNWALNETSNK